MRIDSNEWVEELSKAQSPEQIKEALKSLFDQKMHMDMDTTYAVSTWCVDDVREVAPDLSFEECEGVLRYAERKMDADIGINWDVLRSIAEDRDFYPLQEPSSLADIAPQSVKDRLEYLRSQIEAECISQDEILELESLATYIQADDVQLLQWANVPENQDE